MSNWNITDYSLKDEIHETEFVEVKCENSFLEQNVEIIGCPSLLNNEVASKGIESHLALDLDIKTEIRNEDVDDELNIEHMLDIKVPDRMQEEPTEETDVEGEGNATTKKGGEVYQMDCEHCNKRFKDKRNFEAHILKHRGTKPHRCATCDSHFTRLQDLKRHKVVVHTGERAFVCGTCGKAYTRRDHLNIHKLVHTGVRPYHCDICGKTFSRSGTLNIHTRLHTGTRPYECDICGKAFTKSGDLDKHKRVHTGARPYKCDMCPKGFAESSALKIHKRIHTGARPYKCNVCSTDFTHISSLKRHTRSHH